MDNKWKVAFAVLIAVAVFNNCGATEGDGQEVEASTGSNTYNY